MGSVGASERFPRSSPYWPVVTHRVLGRMLPSLAVSALGDGMAVVAVSWLALQIAPPDARGTWVGVAVAAYTLPSVVGAVVFGRFLRAQSGVRVLGWNAALRACALAAIPVAYGFGALTIGVYVGLLAVSALLHSWGQAGRYTMVAEVLERRHHLSGNAMMTTLTEAATIAGPPLAGLITAWTGAVWVIAANAATFAVLAITCHRVRRRGYPGRGDTAATGDSRGPAARAAGFAVIRRDRTLLGLLGLTFGFFVLFGPVYVALPIHVAEDLHASATTLGVFYTVFGVGAVCGGLAAGHLRRWPLNRVAVITVLAFSLTMLPLGLGLPTVWALVGFAAAGLVWAPFMPTAMALLQRAAPPAGLSQVLAANGTIIVVAIPLGTMIGGPLVTTIGAQPTILACALTTTALGLAATTITLTHHHPHRQ